MPPLWCISAARVVHDQSQATITYQDATFEVFGVPILYLPYFQHPDPSVKRRSGFLIPEYGVSNNLGHTVEVPYYFAIAPNMDFLFHPLYSTKQGVLWQGDFRHRLANGQYTIKFAAIDQGDTDANVSQDLQNTWRGSIETKGLFKLRQLVAPRLGRDRRERRRLPSLLQARQHPADRPRQYRFPDRLERPQLFLHAALPFRRAALERHAPGRGARPPGHRLQLCL